MSDSRPAPFLTASVTARDLALSRGGRTLVRGLSLSARAGEAWVLTGPNGAGKTTLLRALAGLIRPDAGAVTVAPGEASIAYLGHAEGLKPGETVRDALTFWTRLNGGDPVRVEAVMEQLAVAHLASRPCNTLSAGQKRRTALARIVLSDRPVWLLDEPAAPLDAVSRERLARMAAEHRARGGCVIATTHAALGWPETQTLQISPAELSP